MKNLEIIIPSFNESLIIERSIFEVLNFCKKNNLGCSWKIIVLINGTNDNSPQIVKKLSTENQEIVLVEHPEPGRGRALKKYWLESGADILLYMDSDLAVDLEALPKIIKPLLLGSTDLVVGSRFNKASKLKRSLKREASSRTFNFIARFICPHKTKDLQCGFKAINKTVFEKIAPFVESADWFFDSELIIWAETMNFRVLEIPVDWQESRLGKRPSKVNLTKIYKQFIIPLWQLRKKLKHYKAL